MQIIGVNYQGHTFGERGDARMVVLFKLDVPNIPGVDLYGMAHYSKKEKYDNLKGIRIDCKSLVYEPRFNGFDPEELSLLSLDQIVKLIQDWEDDVKAVVPDALKKAALKERAKAHHLECWISTSRNQNGDFRVNLKMEPSINACGAGEVSAYLAPRPYWFLNNFRIGYISKEFYLSDLDELDDKYLEGLERTLAQGYNKMMGWHEAKAILDEKFASLRQFASLSVRREAISDEWEEDNDPNFRVYLGSAGYSIPIDKADPVGSAQAFDAEHFARTVMGVDIASIEAQNRESEQRALEQKKAQNANRRMTEKMKKAKAQEWDALCEQAKKDWSPAPVARSFRR